MFTTVTDVAVSAAAGVTAVFASGKRADGEFAVATTTVGAPGATSIAVDTEAQRVVDDFVSTAGNYPLDLAFDSFTLYVTGNDEVFVYGVTSMGLSLASTVANTGSKTIAVAAGSGAFLVGAGDSVRIGATGRVTGSFTFPGTYTARGVAIRSTTAGVFFLACAGMGGLRILRVPAPSGP
jgi:hypothetical protein